MNHGAIFYNHDTNYIQNNAKTLANHDFTIKIVEKPIQHLLGEVEAANVVRHLVIYKRRWWDTAILTENTVRSNREKHEHYRNNKKMMDCMFERRPSPKHIDTMNFIRSQQRKERLKTKRLKDHQISEEGRDELYHRLSEMERQVEAEQINTKHNMGPLEIHASIFNAHGAIRLMGRQFGSYWLDSMARQGNIRVREY